MEKNIFIFSEFLKSKGFEEINSNTYLYKVDENFTLKLTITDDEYIIPFALDKKFRSKIPPNEEKAAENFKTIGDLLDIYF